MNTCVHMWVSDQILAARMIDADVNLVEATGGKRT